MMMYELDDDVIMCKLMTCIDVLTKAVSWFVK